MKTYNSPQTRRTVGTTSAWRYFPKLPTSFATIALLLCFPAYSDSLSAKLEGVEETPEFLPVEEAFQVSGFSGDGNVTLIWSIAPKYYLYGHKFRILDGDTELTEQATFAPGIRQFDEYFGDVEVYRFQAIAELNHDTQDASQEAPIELTVQYQGCADAGLCYPVQTTQLQLQHQ